MVLNNLIKRTITGIALALIITLAISMGLISFSLLVLTIDLVTLSEFYRLFRSPELIPRKTEGLILSLSILISFTIFINGVSDPDILLINVPVVFSIFIFELYLKADSPFLNLAITFLGIICITIPLCFLVSVAVLPIGHGIYHSQIALGYFFILWASDSGAYFIGKYFGRHHLFERLSPKKTWEGSIGGMVSALTTAYITSYFFTTINSSTWIIMAFIIVVTGTFGDLIKSLMKRSLHLKDSGTILPGHGGMLDRFDTMLGSAPFVYCHLILFANA
jgi:phosphatidate cytidylyltransferase